MQILCIYMYYLLEFGLGAHKFFFTTSESNPIFYIYSCIAKSYLLIYIRILIYSKLMIRIKIIVRRLRISQFAICHEEKVTSYVCGA
jgi:hypothetical protein